ncbi:MAG: hypothetical protein AAFR39_05055 [Pseudomonadota bacterium]
MNWTHIRNAIAALAVLLTASACNSTDDTLTLGGGTGTSGPGTSTPNPGGVTNRLPTQPAPPTTTNALTNQVATGQPQLYFAPIVGAPVDKVTILSQRLSATSVSQGVQLLPSRLPTTTHEIRGYFSAVSAGSDTTVIHVWDVFSPQGERVHRIQAQETVSGTAADPWSIVPSAAMEKAADRVLGSYVAWRATQT